MEIFASTIHQSHTQKHPPPAEDTASLNPDHSSKKLVGSN